MRIYENLEQEADEIRDR